MIPIYFKAKPFVKAYLLNDLPECKVDRTTIPGKYLLGLLEKGADHKRKYELVGTRYPEDMILYVSPDAMERFGGKVQLENMDARAVGKLNVSQTMDFNDFISKLIRMQVRPSIVTYLYFDQSITRAIRFAREILNIDPDLYDDEAIRKDLQRYREKSGRIPMIYKKHSEQLSD